MSDDLVQFLRDRYAERQALAETASPWPWRVDPEDPETVLAADGIVAAEAFALSGNQTRNTARFIATNDPAAILADLHAKLALINDLTAAQHEVDADCWYVCAAADRRGGPCDCGRDQRVERRLRILAQPFAGHPDCKEEWTT